MVHNLVVVVGSGHHLGPQEPGQFAGDRGGHDGFGVLAGGQGAEPSGQAQLRGPCAGDHLWVQPELAAGNRAAHIRSMPVGPGRLDQLRAQVGVAGLGQPTAVDRVPAGVFAWDQAAEPHELGRSSEPAPVAHLGGQGEPTQAGHPAVGGQPGDLVGEGWAVQPGGQVHLDRIQLSVAGGDHRPVVDLGGPQRWLVEALAPSQASCLWVQADPPRHTRP